MPWEGAKRSMFLVQSAARLSEGRLWAGRREAVTPEVVADFLASKQYGMEHIEDIADAASIKLELPATALETYLTENIDYSLDEENLRGLESYYERCAAAGLISRARPLEFARMEARAQAGR